MDIALVTGADAGPGLAIARRLIGMGCRVYALATQFPRNPFPHDDFITLAVNLADPEALTKVAEDIVARDGHINYVVHAARQSPVSLLDSPVSAFVERVNIGLLAPVALARVTLPWLRKEQGHFLVLAWNGDGPSLGGPVSAAIEGGLHHFAEALFEELGSDGVKATTLYARPNKETPPEALMSLDPQSAINPELVADTVEQLFRSRPTNLVSTLTIRPVANAETPRVLRSSELAGLTTRDVQLPPRQNFPQEPEPISTPVRARPADAPYPVDEEFDEEDEEDDEFDPTAEPLPWAREDAQGGAPREGGEQSRPQGDRPPSQGDRPPQGGRGYDPDRGYGPQGGGRGRGRRRGRGGRGRGRGDNYDNRPPQGGRGPQRPQGGGDNRSGPPSQERGPDQGPARPDYPDPEEESERRALARDDSFRTPHSESEDNGGDDSAPRSDEGSQDYIPREDNSRGGDESREERDDRDSRSDDREPQGDRAPQGDRGSRGDDYQPGRDRSDRAPGNDRDPRDENRGPRDENRGSREDDRGRSDDRGPRDDNREPVPAGERREYRGDDRRDDRRGDPRDQRDDRRPQQDNRRQGDNQGSRDNQQGQRPPQGSGQQGQGHGRRHRGFGRKPPPGGGRGPTRE